MNILHDLQQAGLEKCASIDRNELRVDNIILGKSLYTMAQCDDVFTDMNLCITLLEDAYGFSYFHDDISYKLEHFVNKRIPEVLEAHLPTYFRVAIVDAIYSLIHSKQGEQPKHYFSGNLREKATQRAQALLHGIPEGANVALLGAVSEIVQEARDRLININVIDLQSQKVGLNIDNNDTVQKSTTSSTNDIFKNADYAIASGMIFATQTAEEVFESAKKHDTKLILFMETGANFGRELTRYGAYRVLSEYFPFYDFHGNTRYDLFEQER
jgi:hypothetical protein